MNQSPYTLPCRALSNKIAKKAIGGMHDLGDLNITKQNKTKHLKGMDGYYSHTQTISMVGIKSFDVIVFYFYFYF